MKEEEAVNNQSVKRRKCAKYLKSLNENVNG